LSTNQGQRISPASFSLRVGNACVLVTILPKNDLLMSSQNPLLSPLAILRTPVLFCSLIGTCVRTSKSKRVCETERVREKGRESEREGERDVTIHTHTKK
jgi:hypothetical protein